MSNKNQDDNLIDVGEVYNKSEEYLNKNGKLISTVVIGAILLIAAFFLYKKMIVAPKNEEAQTEIWKSQYYFGIDSLRLALEGDEEYLGFLDIADEYRSTPAGNLASYYAGVSLLRQGEFERAISRLKDCSFDNILLESQRLGNIGDALIETGDINGGVDYFNKSIAFSANEATAPIYLKKAGLAYQELGNNTAALASFLRIKDDFSKSTEARSIDKYIAILESAK